MREDSDIIGVAGCCRWNNLDVRQSEH